MHVKISQSLTATAATSKFYDSDSTT